MLDDIAYAIINFVKHRVFALGIVFIILMAIIVFRLFNLQIIKGQDYLDNFSLTTKKTITTSGQRGNIYDVNGELLAYNRLTYSVTLTNDDSISEIAEEKNESENDVKNEIINEILDILEENDDSIVNTFEIKLNKKGNYVFSSKNESTVNLFKKEVYKTTLESLTRDQKEADALEVLNYLKSDKMFGVSGSYDEERALQIVAIRYLLYMNRYNQYVPVTVAMDVSDSTVAAIKENAVDLPGADIETDSMREYNSSPYMSEILGYTGIISEEEKAELNEDLDEDEQYTGSEVVGKTGLEQRYESVLRGKNGSETVYVNSVGQIIDTDEDSIVEATTGNDIYLSIDSKLQEKCYQILENHLAGIILKYFQNTNVKRTTKPINITTTEVYFALFDNNVIDMEHLSSKKASDNEKLVYDAIVSAKKSKFSTIRDELLTVRTPQDTLSDENQEYMSYIYKLLVNNDVLHSSDIDSNDSTYQAWKNDNISLGEFLEYAIHKSWINSSDFNLESDYYDTEELMKALVDYLEDELSEDTDFSKMVLENLIDDGTVDGRTCCLILFDQGVLSSESDEDYDDLLNGSLSAYSFMYRKIQNLEITPEQLALDPCSGSVVVTDVNTGKVKALVSYPSYDNNKLANGLDEDYYNELVNDKTTPFVNRATQSSIAPGSTFKMVSATAGLSEGVITTDSKIECKGIYDIITPSPKCSIYPSSHGKINVVTALEFSCNCFFFEVGHRLATKSNNEYDEELGLSKLKKYAAMYGLDSTSGVELDEISPQISDQDAVRSAIGQGTHSYAPVQLSKYVSTIANGGTCYNLSILSKETDNDGNVVKEYEPTIYNQVELSDEIWDDIHTGMYQVVNGKTHGAEFESMYTKIAGKTGTAEEDTTRSAHGLFVSYAPYEDPEISITVVIPHGYASANSINVAHEVYLYYFKDAEAAAAKADAKNKKTATDEEDADDGDDTDDTDDTEDTEEETTNTAVIPTVNNTNED